jgi:hypothetical protein
MRTRQVDAPRVGGEAARARWLWLPRLNPERLEALRAYDDDTVDIFWEQFGDSLVHLVRLLREEKLIGAIEAQRLTSPSTPDEVERIGRRLVELGSRKAQIKPPPPPVDMDLELRSRRGSRSPASERGGSRA